MPNTLLIIGAGVDRTNGIDFPLANTLLSAISNYAENEGQEVDQKLRKFLPNLRFTFSSIITQAIEKITTRDISEQRHMIERLQQVTDTIGEDNVVKKHGELLVKLFNKQDGYTGFECLKAINISMVITYVLSSIGIAIQVFNITSNAILGIEE